MRINVAGPLASCLFFSVCLSAAEVKGTVVDPSGARIAGARVSVVTPLGVVRSFPSPDGTFACSLPEGSKLVITAPGFAAKYIAAEDAVSGIAVRLDLAPVVDSVRVAGSAMDVEASSQGGSVSIIPREEIQQRNEPMAVDLLRSAPGVTIGQTGPTGAISGLYIRGGDPKYNLVEIDGVPVNAFGGDFDFFGVQKVQDKIGIARADDHASDSRFSQQPV